MKSVIILQDTYISSNKKLYTSNLLEEVRLDTSEVRYEAERSESGVTTRERGYPKKGRRPFYIAPEGYSLDTLYVNYYYFFTILKTTRPYKGYIGFYAVVTEKEKDT